MQTDFTLAPGATPLEIARKRKLAEALMREGSDTSPVRHWAQGAARLAQALRGVQEDWSADSEQRKYNDYGSKLGSELDGSAPQQASGLVGALSGQPAYDKAISSIESGGNYAALGPVTKTGDRAFGKYQVMGANIPSWSEAALGKKLSAEEFVADPKAQDAVFNHRFGQYVQQTGNPQDAASMWFTGKPLAQAGNVRDQLGTTAPAYVEKFTKALGGQQGQQTMVGGDTLGQTGPSPQRLMAIMSDPNAPPEIKARARMMYQEAQKNTGPEGELRRLQIEKARRDINAPAPDNRPSGIREYEYAKSQGFEGSLQDWKTQQAKAGATSVTVNGDPKLTEQQSKDLFFYSRATEAAPLLDKYEKALTGYTDTAKASVPYFGTKLASEEYQLGMNAGRNWLATILRKDTGAAVTKDEMHLYGGMFLPQPGEPQAMLDQKRAMRQNAVEGLRSGLGPAKILADARDKAKAAETPKAEPQKRMKFNPKTGEIE